jgi:2',3'-cyclic-nucleotide 2'-phosphodiesterase (5'-nucleotidase family)
MMNAMRFDAMVLGNHEFDFGQEELKKRMIEATFPVLGANVEELEHLKPFVILERGGVKVGLIGVVTEETPLSTHPRNVSGLRFLPPAKAVEKYVKELKNKTDMIIVLSHLGHGADRLLAQQVKGIDLIVGGHSHTKIARPARIGNTLIVQAWEHGKALGVLDLKIKGGEIAEYEGRLAEVKPLPGKEDRQILAIVEKYAQKVDAVLGARIGVTEVELDGENVRREETNLGNFVADILLKASKADAVIINGGSIRTSIKQGEIRVKDVYSALPFGNCIMAIRLTGRQIAEALEHGVSIKEAGGFPQVAGLSFTYSLSSAKGARIKEIVIAGRPIEPGKEYIVATNDFLAVGGDGYKTFADALKSSGNSSMAGGTIRGEKVVYADSSRWIRNIVVDYIREKGKISPRREGRITEVP